MDLRRHLFRLCIGFMVIFGLCLPARSGQEATEKTTKRKSPYIIAVVLQAKHSAKVRPILLGFKAAIDEAKIPVLYKVIPFQRETIDKLLAAQQPDLVLTVGGAPTRWLWPRLETIPMVFAKVYEKPSGMPEDKNVSGAVLAVPVKIQLEHLLELAPKVKKVGIIYYPPQNQSAVENIAKEAQKMDILVKHFPINSVREIPKIKSMGIDALWIIPDTMICRLPITKRFIISCTRLKIPIMGFSSYYARAGILICLQCDMAENGKQAGDMAAQILTGEQTAPTIVTPRKIDLYLNQTVARRIGIKLPKKLVKKAKKVYGK